MNEAPGANAEHRDVERFELLIAALVLASVVGALFYFAATGLRYNVGESRNLQNPLAWIGAVARLFFAFASRLRLARLGWRLGIAIAILTLLTPLGDPGLAPWVARAVGTIAWTSIVLVATLRAATVRWRTIALIVFFAEVALRYWSLQNWDDILDRSTVLWGTITSAV